MVKVELTRKELYDLVWSKPMTQICQQFGLSDNGLRKHCKKLNIPTPYLGYWSKLQYGKNVKKMPLPKMLDSNNDVVSLSKLNEQELAEYKFKLEEPKPDNPMEVIEEELNALDPKIFVVPENLYAKDPLIFDTKERYRDHENRYLERNPYTSKANKSLNVDVSKELLNRALRIFLSIIRVIRKRGNNVIVDEGGTFAVIKGERIWIRLVETTKRIENGDKNSYSKYSWVKSGRLRFEIKKFHTWSWNDIVKIEDSDKHKLEDCILAIVAKIELEYMHILEEREKEKKREEERKEQERIRLEKEHIEKLRRERHDKEISDLKSEFINANRYHKANILRSYLIEYKNHLTETEQIDEKLTNRIEWLEKKIEWMDPFINREDEILNDDDLLKFV